jgi:hypothetical protein
VLRCGGAPSQKQAQWLTPAISIRHAPSAVIPPLGYVLKPELTTLYSSMGLEGAARREARSARVAL